MQAQSTSRAKLPKWKRGDLPMTDTRALTEDERAALYATLESVCPAAIRHQRSTQYLIASACFIAGLRYRDGAEATVELLALAELAKEVLDDERIQTGVDEWDEADNRCYLYNAAEAIIERAQGLERPFPYSLDDARAALEASRKASP